MNPWTEQDFRDAINILNRRVAEERAMLKNYILSEEKNNHRFAALLTIIIAITFVGGIVVGHSL